MAEEGKKISFGFSKSLKKPALKNVPPPQKKKIDYIECVDHKAIKIVGGEEKKDEPLVIPMLGSKTWHDRILNKVDADIFEPKPEPVVEDDPMRDIQIKQEKISIDDVPNENNQQPMEISEIKKEPESNEALTLEEQAAREIIADIKANEGKAPEKNDFTVPIAKDDLKGKEESTLDDYENIPIEAFGMAMLRGMGWQPGKGIGKNEKVIPAAIPELRPKGMGLGADKLAIQNTKKQSTKGDEELKVAKGSYVKITAGKHAASYGKVEGFDDDVGRVILKLALSGEVISVNEGLVQAVSSTEYNQNSKVLNVKKYEEYKNNEVVDDEKDRKHEPSKNSDESNDEDHKRGHRKSKKKSKKRKESSSDDSSVDRKARRRRDSSRGSDEEQKQKKSKKSKKHKSRDSSAERSSRKSRKKDKDREKKKSKKSDYSDSEKTKHKSRRRSRSRSYSPRNERRARSRSYSPKK